MAMIHTSNGSQWKVEASRVEVREFLATPDPAFGDWRTFSLADVAGLVTLRASEVVAIEDTPVETLRRVA